MTLDDDFGPQILLADVGLICVRDSMELFPDVAASLTHHLIALGGEVGELMNVYKKIERGSLPAIEINPDNESRQMLLDEATDVLIYLANIIGLLKGNAELMLQAKRAHNFERFTSDDNG